MLVRSGPGIEEWGIFESGLRNAECGVGISPICNQNESKIQNLKSEIPCVDAGSNHISVSGR
jgi:hypothetical protein